MIIYPIGMPSVRLNDAGHTLLDLQTVCLFPPSFFFTRDIVNSLNMRAQWMR